MFTFIAAILFVSMILAIPTKLKTPSPDIKYCKLTWKHWLHINGLLEDV